MDHGQGEECYFLVCWFACRDCLRDTVLDGYAIFRFVCLDGWMDGWMDGWLDGWMDGRTDGRTDGLFKSRQEGVRGRAQRYGMGGLVAWFVGCLVGLLAWPRCCLVACLLACLLACLVAWLVGWLVGTPLMDAWMDGWMDPVLPHVPEASGSVSGGSRHSGQSLRWASNKKLLG